MLLPCVIAHALERRAMNCFKSSENSDESLRAMLRADFIKKISENNLAKSNSVITEIFIAIFDHHLCNEKEFTEAVVFTLFDLLTENTEAHKIGQLAFEFYDQSRSVLASQSNNIIMAKLMAEIPLSLPFKGNILRKDVLKQFLKACSCPIEWVSMTRAVTLSCGHSLNQEAAEVIYGSLDSQGRLRSTASCYYCAVVPLNYTVNNIVRKAASLIEEIVSTCSEDEIEPEINSNQIALIKSLRALFVCSTTFKPLTKAVMLFHDRVNDLEGISTLVPDFTVRELAHLAQDFTSPQ